MIFDKDNACRVNKLSNEIGDQVRYILRSEVILPMYPRRAAPRAVTTPLHLPWIYRVVRKPDA